MEEVWLFLVAPIWPCSSVGRAKVICSGGRGFEPHRGQRFFFAFLRRYYLGYLLEHFNLSHLILYVSKIPNAISTNLLVVGSDDSEIDEEEQNEEMSESTVGSRSVTPTTETDDEP